MTSSANVTADLNRALDEGDLLAISYQTYRYARYVTRTPRRQQTPGVRAGYFIGESARESLDGERCTRIALTRALVAGEPEAAVEIAWIAASLGLLQPSEARTSASSPTLSGQIEVEA